ncbi:MAG: hypothetical protein FGM46_08970 [Ferruginibacter sp.]|nr:hypothetical protein [Ferruginibacter sp.]
MSYLFFSIYLIAGLFIIIRIPFIKKSGLSVGVLALLLMIKITAGLLAVWLPYHYAQPNDYWPLHNESINEYHLLWNDPKTFIGNIFYSPYGNHHTGFFSVVGSYWNDLRTNLVIKILALFNVASRENIYINVLLLNIIGFIGPIALYRTFITILPGKSIAVLTACFLLPSTIFFTSAPGKDLIIFTALSLFIYGIYFSVTQKANWKKGILILLSLLILLLMRNYVVVALIPAAVSFVLGYRKKISPLKINLWMYSLLLLLMVVIPMLNHSIQPLQIISKRQQAFLALEKAASQLPMDTLQPNPKSFLQNLPQAINHGFARPYPWDKGGKFTPFWSVEILGTILLMAFGMIKRNRSILYRNHFLFFLLSFSIIMFVLTGYIVPNSSSIVRYKCIYLPLLITPVLCILFDKRNNYNHIK